MSDDKLEKIEKAFNKDGYTIIAKEYLYDKKNSIIARGYEAKSKKVTNFRTGKHKSVFYLEGNAFDMGYLMGHMAAKETHKLLNKFPAGIISGFAPILKKGEVGKLIRDFIMHVLEKECKKAAKKLPPSVLNEMKGILAGVKAHSPLVKVTIEQIYLVNMGFDVITSLISDLKLPLHKALKKEFGKEIDDAYLTGEKQLFKPHVFCNAFSVFGKGTKKGEHFFGRQFQFDTGGVFQDVATMVISKPTDGRIPLVAVTAPGFAGAMTAMNQHGVAMGVDSVVAVNADRKDLGINSLLLVKNAMFENSSAAKTISYVQKIHTGVPWLYPLSDGTSGQAAVLEVGANMEKTDPWDFVEPKVKTHAKGLLNPLRSKLGKVVNGTFARMADYKQPYELLEPLNKGLLPLFGEKYHEEKWKGSDSLFASYYSTEKDFKKAFPGKKWKKNTIFGFGFYFFPPQRETQNDLILVSNQYFNPFLRLYSMNLLINMVTKKMWTTFQWRYDYLNQLLQKSYGKIDFAKAWKIINFITADKTNQVGKDFAVWYGTKKYSNKEKTDKSYEISGEVSLMDLKQKKIQSTFGYVADKPLQITLPNYL